MNKQMLYINTMIYAYYVCGYEKKSISEKKSTVMKKNLI